MSTRTFALIYGIVFLIIGAAGFIPGLLGPDDRALAIESMHGRLFGLFPVNVLHNLFHLAFGIWGLLAYRSFSAARGYAKATAVVYAVLVVFGIIPGLNTVFGLIPLHAHDIWLHALLALPAAYFGFAGTRDRVAAETHAQTATGTRPR